MRLLSFRLFLSGKAVSIVALLVLRVRQVEPNARLVSYLTHLCLHFRCFLLDVDFHRILAEANDSLS